jgi:osmoprotectant transport system substrate-binding protein
MRPSHLKTALLAVLLAGVLSACGSSKSNSSSASTGSASGSTSSSSTAAGTKPGAGKPAIVIGDKNFTEEYILGDLYAQALQAKGYSVTLKPNIGSSEITWKALTSGQIDMYPEYTGTLLTAIAGDNKPPTSAQQTYTLAQAYAQKHGFSLLAQTPFYDTDVMATTKAYATAHHLKSIGDLKALGKAVKLGAAPEFATRFAGLVGIKSAYGVDPTFTPLAIGLTYKALDSGQVNVVDAFSTDPQLLSGKYVPLSDPQKVFGFQNVAPVVKTSLLSSEGPAFAQTLNAVSALLTLTAIQRMNAAVAIDQQSPAKVAHAFLAANGLA